MRKDIIGLVALMVLVVFVFLSFSTGAVVYNPKAVPRVEVKTVDSDFIWDEKNGHYDLEMPNLCGLSDEQIYQQIVRLFPKEEARLNSLSLDDVVFMMPDDASEYHNVIFKHWQRFGTINAVFYNAIVAKKQLRSYADVEAFIRSGGL